MELPFLRVQGCLPLGTNKLGAGLWPGRQGPEHSLAGPSEQANHPIGPHGKTFCPDLSAPENAVDSSGWSVLDSAEALF